MTADLPAHILAYGHNRDSRAKRDISKVRGKHAEDNPSLDCGHVRGRTRRGWRTNGGRRISGGSAASRRPSALPASTTKGPTGIGPKRDRKIQKTHKQVEHNEHKAPPAHAKRIAPSHTNQRKPSRPTPEHQPNKSQKHPAPQKPNGHQRHTPTHTPTHAPTQTPPRLRPTPIGTHRPKYAKDTRRTASVSPSPTEWVGHKDIPPRPEE